MKLRIKGNSIRLRLTKSDVRNLAENGMVEEHTSFGTTVLSYALQKAAELDQPHATFSNNRVAVFLPQAFADAWPNNEVVGISHKLRLPDTGSLDILVEKDFVCLDDTTEDQSDHYANPNQTCTV